MKKEQMLVFACSLASVGMFWLAIEMWMCGDDASCRQNNQVVNNIAGAAITTTIPTQYDGWSGRAQPNFSIAATGSSSSIAFPIRTPEVVGGGDGGDGC